WICRPLLGRVRRAVRRHAPAVPQRQAGAGAARRLRYNVRHPLMSKDAFTLRYLAHTAAGVPRDLANTLLVSKLTSIRPTVLIYNCTWVCDAKCEMCNNWKHGDRKSDMTLAQLEPAMRHPFWGAIENLNISGGEPTTRNDLPE